MQEHKVGDIVRVNINLVSDIVSLIGPTLYRKCERLLPARIRGYSNSGPLVDCRGPAYLVTFTTIRPGDTWWVTAKSVMPNKLTKMVIGHILVAHCRGSKDAKEKGN